MTDPVGRGDYVLGVDTEGVKKGTAQAEQTIRESASKAEDEYADSGKRAANRWGSAITVVAKGTAGVIASAFALATAGTLALDKVVADFRAETGATADEADRAGDAINEMSRRNIQPVSEIGAALTKVHTDMGLVGEEAETTTQRFLRFARATKQDAGAAVIAFDDILDAWNLTAGDSQTIMDYLVASHQRYGGSIEDNQRQLAALAPQLRALNLDWRDGVNLLNLFASSGLDAGKAQQALNTAIQNLPAGESLEEFIARLAKVTDDGERARLAIEVFGARGGAGLANAIKPGMTSLDAFGFTIDEVTGKSDEAANALDDTFGARVQLMLKNFGGAITSVGRDLGPLLSGIAGLASLGGALGLERAGPKIVAFFKELGSRSGDAFGDGLGDVASGAEGTVAGNFVASRIEAIVDSTKNSKIANAVRVAGAKAAALYSAFFALGVKVADGIVTAIAASPIAGPVRAAVLTAGLATGGAFGSAFSIGMAAALIAGVPAAVLAFGDATKKFIDEHLGKDVFKLSDEQLGQPPLKLPPATQILWFQLGEQAATAVGSGFAEGAGSIEASVRDSVREVLPRGIEAAKPGVSRAVHELFDSADFAEGMAIGTATVKAQITELAGSLARELAAGGANLATVSAELAKRLPEAVEANRDEVRRQAVLSMVDYAAGLRDQRAQIQAAIDLIGTDLENSLSTRQERLLLQGQLAGKNITKGLKSSDPVVRAQAQGTVALIGDRLKELGVDASTLGGKAGKNYAKAMGDTKPLNAAAAEKVTGGATTTWERYKATAYKWGYATGKAYADALRSTFGLVHDAAVFMTAGAAGPMKASSPPGPESPLHHIGDWATATIDWYARKIRDGRGRVADAFSYALGGTAGVLASDTVAMMGEVRSLGSIRVEHTLSESTARDLAAAGYDAGQVGAALADGVNASGLFDNLRQLQALTSG